MRPFEADDTTAAFAIFGDPAVMQYSLAGVHTSLDQTAAFLASRNAYAATHGHGFWALTERDSGALVGMCGLELIRDAGVIELAYRLRRDRWGQGYASEAAAAWLARGFAELALERIVAFIEPANTASARVAVKIGMQRVRRTRYHGVPVDLFAIDRPTEPAGA